MNDFLFFIFLYHDFYSPVFWTSRGRMCIIGTCTSIAVVLYTVVVVKAIWAMTFVILFSESHT